MKQRGDVSFTFMDRVLEIEENIEDKRLQSALALALTLPDICGGIAYPELVKKYRDGKIMRDRNGEPSRDTGKQYIQWVNTYGAPFLKKDPGDPKPYISGERCWQLRCEYLHQNKGFDNEGTEEEVHFHLGINCGSSVCSLDSETGGEDGTAANIRLDILELCRRLCLAARNYYEQNKDRVDFELYNTPVIDFIRWKEEGEPVRKIVGIVSSDKLYGAGLKLALTSPYRTVYFGMTWEDVKKKLKKSRPDIWIVDESLKKDVEREIKAGERAAVFFLRGYRDAGGYGNAGGYKNGKESDLETETGILGENPAYSYLERTMSIKEIRKRIRLEK